MPQAKEAESVAVSRQECAWRVGETRVSDGAEVKLAGWGDGRKLIVSFEFHVGNK